MKIRVEPFVSGFMTSMKPRLEPIDREFIELVYKHHSTSKFASPEELNPAKAAYYFRFQAAHLNVLLPTWLLNSRMSGKSDRFRIAVTNDHAFVVDTRESIFYDPTTEVMHQQIELHPFWNSADWKDEVRLRYSDELQQKRLKVVSLTEWIECIPDVYRDFVPFIARHRCQSNFPNLRPHLQITAESDAQFLIDLALEELRERAKSKAA